MFKAAISCSAYKSSVNITFLFCPYSQTFPVLVKCFQMNNKYFEKIFCIISVSVGVAAINIAIETGDVENLLKCLQNPDVFLHSVTPECSVMYMERLTEAKDTKTAQGL